MKIMKKNIKILLICICIFILSFLLSSCLSSRSKLVRALNKFSNLEEYHIIGTIETHQKNYNTIEYDEVDILVRGNNKIIKTNSYDVNENLLYTSSLYNINSQNYIVLDAYDGYIDINKNFNEHDLRLFDVSLFDIDAETAEIDVRNISIRQNNKDVKVNAYEIILDDTSFNMLLKNNADLDYRLITVVDKYTNESITINRYGRIIKSGKLEIFLNEKSNITRIVLDIDYYIGDFHIINHIVYDILETKNIDILYPDINESNTIKLDEFLEDYYLIYHNKER